MPEFNSKLIGEWIQLAASIGIVFGTAFVILAIIVVQLPGWDSARPSPEGMHEARPEITGQSLEFIAPYRQAELRQFVEEHCPVCHGTGMAGSVGPALSKTELASLTLNAVAYSILYGRQEKGMPAWADQISEQEGLWIAEQLKSGALNQ